jgi:hypothetical protein
MVRRTIVQAIMAGKPTKHEAFNAGMVILEQRDDLIHANGKLLEENVSLRGWLDRITKLCGGCPPSCTKADCPGHECRAFLDQGAQTCES